MKGKTIEALDTGLWGEGVETSETPSGPYEIRAPNSSTPLSVSFHDDPIIGDVEDLQTRRRGHGFAASGSRNTPRKRLPKVTPKIFLPPSNAAAPAMARLSTPPLA